MANSYTEEKSCPIFVGGTGRSGTTIMGKYLNSHCCLVTPVNENKLIVEEGGLRSLVNNLSAGYDYKGNSYAISNFIQWSNTLRKYGFKNRTVSFAYRAVNKALYMTLHKRIPAAKACRALPFLDFSLIGIGEKYGLNHYDRCIGQFLSKIIEETDDHGIVDTEGLVRPMYSSKTSNREELMEHAREFLHTLNEEKMRDADATRWCDDTPLNALWGGFLLELYPTGKVIHMVRDPRDVAASYSEKSWASRDLEKTLSRLNRHYRELINAEESLPEEGFRTFRLEDFTKEPERQQDELCRFVGVDPDGFDGSVSFEASSFGRWKKKFSGKAAELVESRLSEACAHFGYS